MGRRDLKGREPKKPKKGAKKPPAISEFEPTPVVEVVRKKRNKDKDEEEND